MSINVKVEMRGAEQVIKKLQSMVAKAAVNREASVIVGFGASYALFVHENREMKLKGQSRDPRVRRIEAGGDPAKARPRPRLREPKGRYWDPQGKAGPEFLLGPARALRNEFTHIFVTAVRQGRTPAQALLLCGLRLQREAQLRVPVDTGNLKASAFTRLEVGGVITDATDRGHAA